MSKKELKTETLKNLSNNKKNKLYQLIISSITQYISEDKNKNVAVFLDDAEIEYFGHIIETKKFEVKKDEEGEEYYAY